MIETCYNIDTLDNRIEVMKVELGAQIFLLGFPISGERSRPLVGTMFCNKLQKMTNKR